MEPEVILSNRFLRERFNFKLVPQIDNHIRNTSGFDQPNDDHNSNNETSVTNEPHESRLMIPSPAELAEAASSDFNDPADLDTNSFGMSTLNQDLDLCNSMYELKIANSNSINHTQTEAILTLNDHALDHSPVVTESAHDKEWKEIKTQLVASIMTAIPNDADVNVVVKGSNISVDTQHAFYTLTRQNLVDSTPTVTNGTSPIQFKKGLADEISLHAPRIDRSVGKRLTDVVPGAALKRRKQAELRARYLAPNELDTSPPQSQSSNQDTCKRAVEIEPSGWRDLSHLDPDDVMLRHTPLQSDDRPSIETNLSHLDPRDPKLRIAAVRFNSTALNNPIKTPDPIDITPLFTDGQMKDYVRRLKTLSYYYVRSQVATKTSVPGGDAQPNHSTTGNMAHRNGD